MLFRSVELRLPPPQLGFGDIGTFEFISDSLTSVNYAPSSKIKLRLRTGGSTATVKSDFCSKTEEGSGLTWDISKADGGKKVRLPVRYRYRSPVFFEFHMSGKRHCDTFAAVWLQDMVDLEEKDIDIPIWRCNNGTRLSQNYITEANYKTVPDISIEEIGRLRFRGRFKPGTDRDHLRFVSDNDSRETIESWEACFAEGVRSETVSFGEVPPLVAKLHEESLTHGRDVLAQAPEQDKQKWLAKDGTDWTGAFGADPDEHIVDHVRSPSSGSKSTQYEEESDDDDDDDDDDGHGEDEGVDLGITEHKDGDSGYQETANIADEVDGRPSVDTQASTGVRSAKSTSSAGGSSSKNPITLYKDYKSRSRDLHRQQRGLMQW